MNFQRGQQVADKYSGAVGTIVKVDASKLVLVRLTGKNRSGHFTGERGSAQYLPCNLVPLEGEHAGVQVL